MEPGGSLPRSEVPAIGPHNEPDESSQHPRTLLLKDPFKYYIPIYA
jgi:hypothetical protein